MATNSRINGMGVGSTDNSTDNTVSDSKGDWTDEIGPEVLEFNTYRDQSTYDNTLDDVELIRYCPLDNRKSAKRTIDARHPVGELEQLPVEILAKVLLLVDVPSLTRFRRVNRRAMQVVNSIPQYAAMINHCPDVIRAAVSIRAEACSCLKLYETLSTTQCAKCESFGDHLYLLDCRRFCYFCFTARLAFSPGTLGQAPRSHRLRLIRSVKLPGILSSPGWYGTGAADGEDDDQERFTREPHRFQAVITAPYLFDRGLQADWGYFCLGCKDTERAKTRHWRTKYTKEQILQHFKRYGWLVEEPGKRGKYFHSPQAKAPAIGWK